MSYKSWKDIKPQEGKQALAFSLLGKVDFMLWGGSRFGGKETDINLPVHTPEGTKLLRDVKTGDILLNPAGGTTKVLHAHPIHETQVYRMTFSDGSVIDACKDHKWYGAWRCDKNNPFERWDNDLCVKNTQQIFDHYDNFKNVKTRKQFRIPLTQPLEYNTKELPVDPYLLGCLLGDGCITQPDLIKQTTHKDDLAFYLDFYKSLGYNIRTHHIKGNCHDIFLKKKESLKFSILLEDMGLLGKNSSNKFIPSIYLFGDIEQRKALLQGLLDTDGGVYTPTGRKEHRIAFTTTSNLLKEGFCKLAASLGYAVTPYLRPPRDKIEKDGTIYNCKSCWHIEIKSRDDSEAFRLPRKKVGVTTIRDGSWQPSVILKSIEVLDETKKMRCLSVDHPNQLFVIGDGCIVTHNSELLSMIPLPFYKDPEFRAVYFRRTYSEITQSSGLWDKAQSMYPLFKGKGSPSSMTWKFPSGAQVQYRHMQYEQDKESYRGSGQTLIAFDEINKFSQEQVTFLMTCLRSKAKTDSFMVGTLNPDPDSWCLPWVEYYLDEKGLPDPDKVGVIRHFIIKDDEVIFGESEEWFKENHPDAVWVSDPTSETGQTYVRPKTFTFVFFNIFDNPLGLKQNTAYLSELNNLPDHERDTQLWGNWYSRPKGASLWRREWVTGEDDSKVKRISDIPSNCRRFRAWDKGYTEVSKENPSANYTAASPEILKDSDGFYWIVGNYASTNYDPDQMDKKESERVYGRFRHLAGARDNLILAQALHDGEDTTVVLAKDNASGITDHTYTVTKLVENGVRVVADKTPNNTADKKLKDFQPFCNACSNGVVYIVPESFPNKATLDLYLKELENFDPDKKSSTSRRDDWVDATSSAFNAACEKKNIVLPKFTKIKSKTMAASLLSEV